QRVCWLVGHHHTYGLEGGDAYTILIESDFLVNIYEDGLGRAEAEKIGKKYFHTASGRRFLEVMFVGKGGR
ncbi:MAG: HD family phosphohydrolase, partial [Clostridia bacterium]|nr:HD family phosphohydrolase [Clostridia bacterium]